MSRIYTGQMPAAMVGAVETNGLRWLLKMDANVKLLQTIQASLPPNEWKIDCTRLAPDTPQENPVEDIWLQGKTFVRTHALATTCFEQIKDLFVKGIRQKKYFQFPKLMQYTLALK